MRYIRTQHGPLSISYIESTQKRYQISREEAVARLTRKMGRDLHPMAQITPSRVHLHACEVERHFHEENGVVYFSHNAARIQANTQASFLCLHSGDSDERRYYVNWDGCKYSQAAIVYALHHGFWPERIWHINGNTQDDRIENLRSVSPKELTRLKAKQSRRSRLRSGVVEVIGRDGVPYYVVFEMDYMHVKLRIVSGLHDEFSAACAAYRKNNKCS